jgi:tetratricopeptide (TPR) repeat protein
VKNKSRLSLTLLCAVAIFTLTGCESRVLSPVAFLTDVFARAYKQKGDIHNAIAEYERLTSGDPTNTDQRLINPKYYYRLAKLYEEKGMTVKAIARYEKFLDIWKDADEDLPDLIDAKTRLARLKGIVTK